MGREIRYDLYDLFLEKPTPLVPRHLRREVDERMDASGLVLRALDEPAFKAIVNELVAEGIEALAISFLHSYRNNSHVAGRACTRSRTPPEPGGDPRLGGCA